MKKVLLVLVLSFALSNISAQNAPAPSNWAVSVGLLQLTVPKYQGADKYRLLVVPNFDVKYKRWFFFNAYQGVGVNLLNSKKFQLGTSIRYNFGGRDERSDRFPGLEDINDTVLGGAFFNYRFSLFSAGISTYRAIGTLRGSGYYSPNFGMFLPLSKRFFFRFGISARYDDRRYMQGLFGITAEESAKSGLPQYHPKSGWQNMSYTIMPIFKISQRWSVSGIFSLKRFLDQAERSPIIDNKTTYFAGLSLMYKWV